MSEDKQKQYKVMPAANGFIINFEHIENYFEEKNQRIAKTLEEVSEIIKNDLEEHKEKLSKLS